MFNASVKVFRRQAGQHIDQAEVIAVAPLDMYDVVAKAVWDRNLEAAESESNWRYFVDRGTTVQVFQHGDVAKIW
jgi:hypothetical protein